MADWKAPAPDAKDPAGEREEAELYTDLGDSLRTWARSWQSSPQPEAIAKRGDFEAGS
jgi:hypothetical protein